MNLKIGQGAIFLVGCFLTVLVSAGEIYFPVSWKENAQNSRVKIAFRVIANGNGQVFERAGLDSQGLNVLSFRTPDVTSRAAVHSRIIEVEKLANIEFSYEYKLEDVGFRKEKMANRVIRKQAHMALHLYDSSKKRIASMAPLKVNGSTNQFVYLENSMMAFTGVEFFSLEFGIDGVSGHLDIANLEIEIKHRPSLINFLDNEMLSNTSIGNRKFRVQGLALHSSRLLDKRLLQQFTRMCEKIQTQCVELDSGGMLKSGYVPVRMSLGSIDEFGSATSSSKRIAAQHYYIRMQQSLEQGIQIVSPTNQGIFYGLQHLAEDLIDNDMYLQDRVIVDGPAIASRGAVMGLWWYKNQADFLEMVRENRGNRVLNVGVSILGKKLGANWRLPLDDQEKAEFASYMERARNNFIEPIVGIYPGAGDSPIVYSSIAEFEQMKLKLNQLHSLGVKDIMVSFDDLEASNNDELKHEIDLEKFDANLGKAHQSLVTHIYDYWVSLSGENAVYLLPLYYALDDAIQGDRLEYLNTIAAVHADIVFVMTLRGSRLKKTNVEDFKSIIGSREIFIWDNFFSSSWNRISDQSKFTPFYPPLIERRSSLASSVAGYSFLPLMPGRNFPTGIDWTSSFKFMWEGAAYTEASAIVGNVRRHLGKESFEELISSIGDGRLDSNFEIENFQGSNSKHFNQAPPVSPSVRIVAPVPFF